MGFFNSLFSGSKGDNAPRFVTDTAFAANLANQKKMSPMTLAQLRKLGIAESRSLKLEFFFYTDTNQKAQALATGLKELNYQVSSGTSASDVKKFIITGWSTPIKMDETTVVSWTDEMCRLGFKNDAEFDGWGTNAD